MKYLLPCLFAVFFLLSCKPGTNLAAGKKTYTTFCVQCHGDDGKLGLNDSKDLTKSTLEFNDAVNQVRNGKGLMTPYKTILSPEEIDAVVHYVISLRE